MKLDLGCGGNRKEGCLGVDIKKFPGVDVVADLNQKFFPFRDNAFDEIYLHDVLEHLDDILHVLGEVWRVGKNGARVFVRIPHFSSPYAYNDVTHRHVLGARALENAHPGLKMVKRRIKMNRIFKRLGIEFLANRFTYRWEFLSFLLPALYVEFEFEVKK
ncbi:hypothetical protein DRQ18_01715 [bacterium]|nr:MAG: hypothetical protein DRQ18_01715 [bacterium]